MGVAQRFGETYRKSRKETTLLHVCEICGAELEADPEGGEEHCPVCENPEE